MKSSRPRGTRAVIYCGDNLEATQETARRAARNRPFLQIRPRRHHPVDGEGNPWTSRLRGSLHEGIRTTGAPKTEWSEILDFKSKQYGDTDEQKGELLKDLLAIANACHQSVAIS